MSNQETQYTFNQDGVKKLVETYRTVKATPQQNGSGSPTVYPSQRSYLEAARLYGPLSNALPCEAKLVWLDDDLEWQYVDEDLPPFYLYAPSLGDDQSYPEDTIVYCWYHKRSGKWLVDHVGTCPEEA